MPIKDTAQKKIIDNTPAPDPISEGADPDELDLQFSKSKSQANVGKVEDQIQEEKSTANEASENVESPESEPVNPIEKKAKPESVEEKEQAPEQEHAEAEAFSDLNQEDDVNIGELLQRIVSEALFHKSSDVHIEAREEDMAVRYRIDGLLREILTIDKELENSLIFKIKVMAKLRTDEHFAPQDGRIRFIVNDEKLDTRVSILPTSKGEKVVFRLLTSQGKSFELEELGVRGEDLEIVKKAYQKPYGTILAVGPTGSGKTTTLYSMLKILNKPDVNITTIEDPVEYDLPNVNHVQVNVKANLTFANGLRSLLRQDPDIIMIGEIRDSETARIATNAALTGHLVLSTLHTNDAVTTIPRLLDMGIEPFLVASTLNVIIAQRLARKLCQNCKKSYTLTKKIKDAFKLVREDIANMLKDNETLYKAQGCSQCSDTGYKGRIGLYEVLEVSKEIRALIVKGANSDEIATLANKQGLTLMLEDGIQKAREGITTIEELTRVTAIKE